MKTNTISDLKRRLILAQNRVSYWKSRATNPTYESQRKARWRRENPAKYSTELFKNRERAKQRTLP